jgi:hypothetical protein
MAYSNTTGQTTINVDQLISYAFRDAGKTAEEMTPEYIGAAKQALFYNLQNLSNRGVNLWLLDNQLYGALTQQQQLVLPKTVIDVREANWVYVQNIQASAYLPLDNPYSPAAFDLSPTLSTPATSTALENWFGSSYQQAQSVYYVGWNCYAPNSTQTYNFVFEYSDDGINWFTKATFPSITTYPNNCNLASNGTDLFFLSSIDQVYVYDINGHLKTIVSLNYPTLDTWNGPWSQSYTNGRFYVMDSSDSKWSGYRIMGFPVETRESDRSDLMFIFYPKVDTTRSCRFAQTIGGIIGHIGKVLFPVFDQ